MRFPTFSPLVVALAVACAAVAPSVFATDARPTHCVVNGDEFAEHKNPPISVTHDGEAIDVCCKKCVKKFNQEPEKYIKKYKEAQKKEAHATSAKDDTAKVVKGDAAAAKSCCSQ